MTPKLTDHHLWPTLSTAFNIISLDHPGEEIVEALKTTVPAEPETEWQGPSSAGGYTHPLIRTFLDQFPPKIRDTIPTHIISLQDELPARGPQANANIARYRMVLMGQRLVHNVREFRSTDPLTGADYVCKCPADLWITSRPVRNLPIFAPFQQAYTWGDTGKAPYTSSSMGGAVVEPDTVVVPNLASYFLTLKQWFLRTDKIPPHTKRDIGGIKTPHASDE